MVAQAGGYYRTVFKGERGVTQGDLLSPTIFNEVVDAVVRHWVTGVIADAEEQVELGKEGRHHAALFYAYYGMIASSDLQWLQGAFNNLVSLFDPVGLRKFSGKTVGMVCHPCQAAGNLSEAAYGRRVTGGRAYIHGAVKGTGGPRHMRRVVGGRIPVKSYDESTWEGGGDTSAMENPGRGDWYSDLQDDLPGEGRPAELSSGGMPGQSCDKDGNAGALLAPSCPQHRGDPGGSKLPPPTVRPMQHAWAGRDQTRRCQGIFIMRSPRRCYSLGRRRGSSL